MVKIFLLSLFVFPFLSSAQNTGIGTTSPTNKLHLSALADPLRLEGVQSGVSTDSVLTINSTGVVHRRASNAVGNGWQITGNTGTVSTNNFIGTTDNVALVFRTNNYRSGLIEPDSTRRNNSFGNRALASVSTGAGNNASGYQALNKVTTGNNNVGIGDSASFNLSGGNDNISIGADALSSAVMANSNVAIGSSALRNTVSSENVAIGNNAASGNIFGSNIVAIGANALLANQGTFTQLAIGNNALQQINSGLENVAVGYNTGTTLTTGSYNVLIGHYVLSSTASSSNNTIVGHNAGLAYTSGGTSNNTFIGYQSALSQTAGNGNTFVGSSVDLAGTTSVGNSSALGQGVQITASNQVRIGNTSVTSIGGQVGWTTFSDARIKKDIREDVHGLDFILRLRPVTYYYDSEKFNQLIGKSLLNETAETRSKNPVRYSGFLAQEVEQASGQVGYDFSGVDKPANEHTPYGLRYAELVVPLVKAIQELKAQVDAQQKEIEMLRQEKSNQ